MNDIKRTSILCAALLCGAPVVSAGDTIADFDRGSLDLPLVLETARQGDIIETGPGIHASSAQLSEDQIERRIVVFSPGTSQSERTSILKKAGAAITSDLWLINAAGIVTPAARMKSLELGLLANPEVKRIDVDFMRDWLRMTSGTNPKEGQKLPWGIARVNAPSAWRINTGKGIKVAVIDTGIDIDHPDLKVRGGFNSFDPSASHDDDHGHGSHVAGTIAARNDSKGVVGIAPDAELYGVKVLSAEGEGSVETVIAGIQWAVANRMDIANMSLGSDEGSPALEEAIDAATKAGLVIIAAAGNNSGPVGYPAAYKNTIAISSSDKEDRLSGFSSRGLEVDFIAPGSGIESTYKDGEYKTLDGTSMACPHVTGLAVLLLSANDGIRGLYRVRRELRYGATRIPDLGRHRQGRGMIDAAKLVNAARF